MILEERQIAFIAVTGVLVLLVASPVIGRFLVLPRTEFFSEFWLLGSNHMAGDYPFNVTVGEEYRVFLGIENRLGYSAYYKVAVKFRNQTQPVPDSLNRTSSSLNALYEIRTFVADEENWEIPLTFCFDYSVTFMREVEIDDGEFVELTDFFVLVSGQSQVVVHSVTMNDVELEIENCTISWDSENVGFWGNLFFELWIYNPTESGFQYHERFVGIWLVMTP